MTDVMSALLFSGATRHAPRDTNPTTTDTRAIRLIHTRARLMPGTSAPRTSCVGSTAARNSFVMTGAGTM
jgi:hypothetical protein